MLAIQNFGFLWERKYLDRKRGGALYGHNSSHERVDLSKQIAIYVLYDKDMRPVYVGQSGRGDKRLLSRLRDHTRSHLWNRWDYFSWFGFQRVLGSGMLKESQGEPKGSFEDALDELESILIQVMEPALNRQGPRWRETEEFYQYVDDEMVDLSLEDLQTTHLEMLEKLEHLTREVALIKAGQK